MQFYISSQARDGDLDNFFKHEHLPYLLSLPEFGKLHFNVKSDMKHILGHYITVSNITLNVKIIFNRRGCTCKPVENDL